MIDAPGIIRSLDLEGMDRFGVIRIGGRPKPTAFVTVCVSIRPG